MYEDEGKQLRRFIASATLLVLLALAGCGAGPANFTTAALVDNGSGDDTRALQGAIDKASRNGTETNPGVVELQANSDCSNPYVVTGLALKSNIVIQSDTPGSKFCITRADIPTANNSSFAFFGNEREAISNVTVRDFRIQGRGPGNVPQVQHRDHIDFGVLMNPSPRDPQNPAQYSQDLTLTDGHIERMFGVCTFTHYTRGIDFDNITCDDPTKGGIIFSIGSLDGTVDSVSATETGDDAAAITSGADNKDATSEKSEARSGNFVVNNSHFDQEVDSDTTGATFALRGAKDVEIANTELLGGGGQGGALIAESLDADQDFQPTNISIHDSTLTQSTGTDTAAPNDAAVIRATTPSGVTVANNDISYDPTRGCGIRKAGGTPDSGLDINNNRWNPDNPATNVC